MVPLSAAGRRKRLVGIGASPIEASLQVRVSTLLDLVVGNGGSKNKIRRENQEHKNTHHNNNAENNPEYKHGRSSVLNNGMAHQPLSCHPPWLDAVAETRALLRPRVVAGTFAINSATAPFRRQF